MTRPDDSFADFVARIQSGDESAETELVRRFSNRLLSLASQNLDDRIRNLVDPEDAVLSAFRSFFAANTQGKFELRNWNSLWGLISLITIRKCIRYNSQGRAEVRKVGRNPGHGETESEESYLTEAVDRAPTPSEVLMLTETLEQLLGEEDERTRSILALRLQGYSQMEICELVACSERTVRRALHRGKRRLKRLLSADQEETE